MWIFLTLEISFCLTKNFKKGLWTEDYIKNEDLLFFRGDNPYIHQKRGNSTIRFSYARSTNDIIEGTKRIKEFMSKNYE